MSARLRVLIVPADRAEPVEYLAIDRRLNGLRAALDGGYIEAIGDAEQRWSAYCDEEGKLKRLPINERANHLARYGKWLGRNTDLLCGPVVFCGPVDEEGEDTDVPDLLLRKAGLWEWITIEQWRVVDDHNDQDG